MEQIIQLLDLLQKEGVQLEALAGEEAVRLLRGKPEDRHFFTARDVLLFMNEMPGGILIYRADGEEQILYANRAALRIFQCETMAEFLALTKGSFRGMVYPEDLEEVERSIRRQIDASQFDLDYVEYRIRRKDGAIRWIEDYGHFVASRRVGNLFYVFLGDATEKHDRLLTERALLLDEREQMMRNLMEEYDKERTFINQEYLRRLEVIEGLSVNYESILYVNLDADQVVPYRLSSRTEPMFGARFSVRKFSQYVTDYVTTWVYPEDQERVAQETAPEHIRERLAQEQTYYLNYRVDNRGVQQYIQLRLVNVSKTNRVCQLVMGYRRVDEEVQREMEQKQLLESALENAELAVVAKNTFLSNMSHDMRTPLNAIFGFTTLAKMNLKDPEAVRKDLEQVEKSSRQLLNLIDKVLEIAWNESREVPMEQIECDFCGVLQEVYDFLQPQAEEKEIHFSLDDSRVVHRAVYSDQDRLHRLALYLANNAVTYTKPGGRVAITLSEESALASGYAIYRLEVTDTGVGISEDFLEKIYEPFSREKNTTLSGVHGVGLGLTIAKSIVEELNGQIEVRSQVGKGSIFTVRFRFRYRDTENKEGIPQQEARVFQRLLLVEDNEINQEIETELLQEIGFSVEIAENGKLAVERLANSSPGEFDLVLMDIQMPVMDGWEATQAIRRLADPQLAAIPIVALSANVFESDLKKSQDCGLDAHLKKPLDLPLLLKTMEQLAGKN